MNMLSGQLVDLRDSALYLKPFTARRKSRKKRTK